MVVGSKNFRRLVDCGIESIWLIFKTEKSIYKPKANVDEKILSGKTNHHLAPEIRKMLVNGMFGNKDSIFYSDP